MLTPEMKMILWLKAKNVLVLSGGESRFVFFPGQTETGKEDLPLLLLDQGIEMESKWHKGYVCEGEETKDWLNCSMAREVAAAAAIDHWMLLLLLLNARIQAHLRRR